jgi:hypothetical protein
MAPVQAIGREGASGRSMSLFLDIGQGAGLAGASGVRPFLPPLVAGGLARADAGVDFEGTEFSFLEEPAFLVLVLATAVGAYAVERARGGGDDDRVVERGLGVLGIVLGALLFAGSLADGDADAAWIGLPAGAICAALGFVAVAALFARARRRIEGGAASTLGVFADLAAVALAGLSILLPPLGLVALVVFLVLLVRSRGEGDRKYGGLRILR